MFDLQAAACEIDNVILGAGVADGFGHGLSTVSQLATADTEESSGVRGEENTIQSVVQVCAPVNCCHGLNSTAPKYLC